MCPCKKYSLELGITLLCDFQLPAAIGPILKVLADAFTATALFYLGLSMVGKIQSQIGFALVPPTLLIVAKT